MSSNPTNTSNVSNAWRYQREHQAPSAVTEFEKILKQDAQNIDALYGMGLALRDSGKKEAAIEKFPEGVKNALEQAIDEACEMRREQASRIVVPEVGGGGAAGGGKIKFP